jgi:hypothetical protein
MVIKGIAIFFAIILLSTTITVINITPAFTQSVEVANVRDKTSNTVIYANGTHVATFGLEEWIPSPTGYVPYLITDGGTTWNVDMKQFPFKIDKTNCGVTVYNNDKLLNNNPTVLIDKEWWNVGWKQTTGGTWTEVDLSNTSCSINTINNSTGLYLETTKTVGSGQGIGTLTVTYAKAIGEPFKTYQRSTNTDATKTNHIFKFIEKYDNIHLDSISSQIGKITQDGTLTVSFSDISENQLIQIEKSGYNIFNLDITKAYNNFQSVTFTKTGGLADASFDYGRNLITLPVGSSQNLDPTFGYTTGNKKSVSSSVTTGTACPSANSNGGFAIIEKNDLAELVKVGCGFLSLYWDVSSIPDDSTITNTTFRYDVQAVTNAINCDFNEINGYPPSATNQDLFNDIINSGGGTNFVNNDSGCTTISNDKVLDLGTSADSDVTAQLPSNWWGIGITYDDLVRDLVDHDITFGSINELQITYTAGSAPTGAYIDGDTNVGLSSNCAARTTLATLATPFPAGDNIIIAPVQVVSTDAGNEGVDIRLYKSTTLLAQNEFLTRVGTSGKGNYYTILYKDTGAAASPTYTVEACLSATAVDGEAKILAINGFTSTDFTDGTSQALGTTDTTIATKTTSFTSGDNIVLAMVSIDSGLSAQDVVAAGIRLKNNGGTEIASNEYEMSFGTAITPANIQNILLIGKDASAPANAAYTVTGKSANTANGEAKLLIFRAKSYAYTDSGSTAIGTGSTTLATLNTSFAAFLDKGFITATQVNDADAGVETIAIAALDLNEANELSSNQYADEAFAAAGSAGDGFRNDFVYKDATLGDSPTFTIKALASATDLRGEAKVIAFEIANPITQTNCDACNPNMFQNQGWLFLINPIINYELVRIR